MLIEYKKETVKPRKILDIKHIKKISTNVPGYPKNKEEFEKMLEGGTLPTLDVSMKVLLDEMAVTCEKAGGAALAAPQIGVYYSFFIILGEENTMRAIFHPTFSVEAGEETEIKTEGCLSIKGNIFPVERHNKIIASWFEYNSDRVLEYKQEVLSGFSARLFQHEIDHLLNQNIVEKSTLSRAEKRLAMKKL